MCGIVGFVAKQPNNEFSSSLLEKMKKRIAHRGPDSNGSFFWNNLNETYCIESELEENSDLPFLNPKTLDFLPKVALGHNRLAIQDLSSFGHQPMSDENGACWLVLNGEIFNYKEIRADLIGLGYSFFSNSDTEVLLKGYQQYGLDILNRLDGFYAFALYDLKKHKLYPRRDLTGVKPLYFHNTMEAFSFGSEIKTFFDLPDFSLKHTESVIHDFLVHEKIELNRNTFYKNVLKVMPGEVLEYDVILDSYTISNYEYEVKTEGVDLKRQVIKSIKSRLLSDVPIGFALSGGLDSTLISSIASTFLENKIKLFSANSDNPKYDESYWQDIAHKKIEGEWYKTEIDTSQIDFKKINYLQDCPILAANNIANNQLYSKVKEKGVKVLLNGQGADELFAGYPIYYAHYYLYASKTERKELLENIANAPIELKQLKKDILKLRLKKAFPYLFNRFKIKGKPFYKYLAMPIKLDGNSSIDYNLNTVLKSDYFGQRLQEMLHWEDRNSMDYSIESRNPFAEDRVLAKVALALPMQEKIQKGWSKYFLRNSFEEFIPKEIIERTDFKGYSMPDIEWNRKWKNEILQSLQNEKLWPYVNCNEIIKDFDRLLSSNNIHLHKFLFRTMSLSHFLNLSESINELV